MALVTAVTAAIYHRAWEKLAPFEPPHGVARFTLSNPPTLIEQWNTSSVRLPDGRMWTDDYTFDYTLYISPPNLPAWILGDIGLMPLAGGHFLDGSNWVSVIHGAWQEQVGLKADGTLWVSEYPARRERLANGGMEDDKGGRPRAFRQRNQLEQRCLELLVHAACKKRRNLVAMGRDKLGLQTP